MLLYEVLLSLLRMDILLFNGVFSATVPALKLTLFGDHFKKINFFKFEIISHFLIKSLLDSLSSQLDFEDVYFFYNNNL